MDVQCGCLSQHGEKTSLKVENFQGQWETRPDDRGWVKDLDGTRSVVDLAVPEDGGHLDLEYTVDIDLKLRSGEG